MIKYFQSIIQYLRHPLVGHSMIFMGAELLNKGLPFLMLPILTRHLTASEFGVVATLLTFQSILGVLIGLSCHGAVNVAYFKMPREALGNYITSVLAILLTTTLAALFAAPLVFPFFASRSIVSLGWVMALILAAGAQFLTQINLALWQCERRPMPYAIYQFAQTILMAGLSLILVVSLRWGWQGQILSQLVSFLSFAALSLFVLGRRGYMGGSVLKADVMDALRFGVPLVPHALSSWVKTGVDRILLTLLLGASTTGIYAAGYQIALGISVLASAFNRAWAPFLFEQLSKDSEMVRIKLVKIIYVYFVSILLLVLLLFKVCLPAIAIFLGPRFQKGASYVFWIALGYAFDGMYYMVVNQIFYAKKTKVLASITFLIGFAHVALSYILIKKNGALGAAQATTLSFALQFIVVWIASARVYPMPWLFWRRPSVS